MAGAGRGGVAGIARGARRAALALAVSLLVAGCGGNGESGAVAADAPPVADDCLASWNSQTASLTFGRHAYGEHDSRQAQVTVLETGRGAPNVKGKETCAVVFAVPETDYEYGEVGLVVTRFGWASMRELARGEPRLLEEIQREATAAPNANLFPDGSIDPD